MSNEYRGPGEGVDKPEATRRTAVVLLQSIDALAARAAISKVAHDAELLALGAKALAQAYADVQSAGESKDSDG